MNLYEAIAHAFSTLSIGGFSTQNDSVAAFAPITQWMIVVFMCSPASTSCASTCVLVRGQVRAVSRDDEFRLYLVFLAAASTLLLLELLGGEPPRRRGGRSQRRLPGGLDHDDDRVRDGRLHPWGALAS